MQIKTFLFLFMLIGFAGVFSGCGAIVAGNSAANFATEDRAFGDSVQDSENELTLRNALFQKDYSYLAEASVIVAERRVLLTGSVASQNDIEQIVAICWENPYVTEVYNHLTISDSDSVKDSGTDVFLNKKIFAELLTTSGITSANYKTVVKDRIAYIIGSTKSAEEKKKALQAVRSISGIRKIVEYITVI